MFDPTGRLFPPKIHRRVDEEKKAAAIRNVRWPDGVFATCCNRSNRLVPRPGLAKC
jgi:hypothetical protein